MAQNVKCPLVSVIMPVYNGMPFLPMAVESILQQTFSDFEFIIINDGSTDKSTAYLQALKDPRVVLIDLPKNLGITLALQTGLKVASGKYIARLDADDCARADRLALQVQYMEMHPDIVILGSSYQLINEKGQVIKYVNLSKKDLEIRWKLLFKNPFVHSTVIFRREVLIQNNLGYVQTYGEDYQLWRDILQYGKGEITNLPLIKYRVHQHSWTISKNTQQTQAGNEIAYNEIKKYIEVESTKIQSLISFARGLEVNQNAVPEIENLYKMLQKAFLLRNHKNLGLRILFKQLVEAKKRIGLKAILTWWPILLSCLLIKRISDKLKYDF